MGSAGGFAVTASALRGHAEVARSTAATVKVAREAGETVVVGADAYGVLCRPLPVLFSGLQDSVVEGLELAGTFWLDAAEGLTATAGAYEHGEQASVGQVGRVGRGLG